MLSKFINELEQRPPVASLLEQCRQLFQKDRSGALTFAPDAFSALLNFLMKGAASLQHIAVQAGIKWSNSSQKIELRNAIYRRGFLTPSCLWAYCRARGNQDVLFNEFASPEMSFMQIILLKNVEVTKSVPFLIQRFLNKTNAPVELKTAAKECLLNAFHKGMTPEQVRQLCARYPGLEELCQWKPAIPHKGAMNSADGNGHPTDFHQLLRSVRSIEELSSLTRTVYLLSQFHVPLSMKEWNAILLTGLDRFYFSKLVPAGLVEPVDGGYMLSSQPAKRGMVKKFLYESYGMARETILKAQEAKIREEHRTRVRRRELDRQALEMLPDGVVCVDRGGSLYYMNPAAERMLTENKSLKENLFGEGALEKSLRTYSKDRVMARLNAKVRENLETIQLFGNRAVVKNGVKRYDVALGGQVILIRDTTDQHLIDQEIGRLYRHELKAALDVMEAGLETSKQLLHSGNTEEALEFLEQVQHKRSELCAMLEERIDFIRLHSDVFTIRPQKVNLNLVVDKCVTNNREPALKKRVHIVSNHMDIEPIHVLGEERFLKRALDNVVRNAVKFSHPDSQIAITLHKSASEALVQVADEGPGVAPEHLAKIFQLGFTTGGSGRGLYIAKRIVEAHGGRIEVSSTLGKGAVFTLHFPTGQV